MSNLKVPVPALRNGSVLIAASLIIASLFDVRNAAAESIRLGVLSAVGTVGSVYIGLPRIKPTRDSSASLAPLARAAHDDRTIVSTAQ